MSSVPHAAFAFGEVDRQKCTEKHMHYTASVIIKKVYEKARISPLHDVFQCFLIKRPLALGHYTPSLLHSYPPTEG